MCYGVTAVLALSATWTFAEATEPVVEKASPVALPTRPVIERQTAVRARRRVPAEADRSHHPRTGDHPLSVLANRFRRAVGTAPSQTHNSTTNSRRQPTEMRPTIAPPPTRSRDSVPTPQAHVETRTPVKALSEPLDTGTVVKLVQPVDIAVESQLEPQPMVPQPVEAQPMDPRPDSVYMERRLPPSPDVSRMRTVARTRMEADTPARVPARAPADSAPTNREEASQKTPFSSLAEKILSTKRPPTLPDVLEASRRSFSQLSRKPQSVPQSRRPDRAVSRDNSAGVKWPFFGRGTSNTALRVPPPRQTTAPHATASETTDSPTGLMPEPPPAESPEPPATRDERTEPNSFDDAAFDLHSGPSDDASVVRMAQPVTFPSAKNFGHSVEITDEPAMTDLAGPTFADVTGEPTVLIAQNGSQTAVTSQEPAHSFRSSDGPAPAVVNEAADSNEGSRVTEVGERQGHANDGPLVQEPAEPTIVTAQEPAFADVDGTAEVSEDEPVSDAAENSDNAADGPLVQELAEPTIVTAQEPKLADVNEPADAKESEPASKDEEAENGAEAPADDGLYEDGLKSIHDLTADIRPEEGEMPEDAAAAKFSREGQVRHAPGTNRPWPLYEFWWEAPAVAHRSLCFEEVNLERYGYSYGLAQPLLSGAHFFGKIPALPYLMTAESPRDYVYTLGHYRPGSYAPYHIHYPPLSLRAAAVEAAAVTGLIFAIP